MNQYICYYFEKRIASLTKTKKAYLKTVLSPLLVEYYGKSIAPTDVVVAMSASAKETATFASGIECGIGDDVDGLSAQDV